MGQKPKNLYKISLLVLSMTLNACENPWPTTISQTPSLTITSSATSFAGITTNTPTASAVPQSTPFLVPEGLSKDVDEYLSWLFAINIKQDCLLPCWWGFVPGRADLKVAKEILRPFQIQEFDPPRGFPTSYSLFGMSAGGSYIDLVSIGIWAKNGVIDRMHISFGLLDSSYSGIDVVRDNYSMNSILIKYGQPSRVLLGLVTEGGEPADTWEFELWLLYEKEGFLINYRGSFDLPERTDEVIEVCPRFNNINFIELTLRLPEDDLANIPQFTVGTESEIREQLSTGELLSWEEATGLSIEHFVQAFGVVGATECFESPVNVWK